MLVVANAMLYIALLILLCYNANNNIVKANKVMKIDTGCPSKFKI